MIKIQHYDCSVGNEWLLLSAGKYFWGHCVHKNTSSDVKDYHVSGYETVWQGSLLQYFGGTSYLHLQGGGSRFIYYTGN
jgi:hypothetical protein